MKQRLQFSPSLVTTDLLCEGFLFLADLNPQVLDQLPNQKGLIVEPRVNCRYSLLARSHSFISSHVSPCINRARVTGAVWLTSASARAGATRVMPCLVRVGENDGACDICGVEKKMKPLSLRGRNAAVGFHARHSLHKRV